MRNDHLHNSSQPEPAGTPTHCPTCRSQDLKTTSKTVTDESYWRCGACGEVWNVRRRASGSRYAMHRPFGR
jgi:transposase-like protein